MTCVFVQIRCKPGTTYRVAQQIVLRGIHSELYSKSGAFDLLMKLYIPGGADVGKYINDKDCDPAQIDTLFTALSRLGDWLDITPTYRKLGRRTLDLFLHVPWGRDLRNALEFQVKGMQ